MVIIYFFGQTYAKEDNLNSVYMIKLSNITTKNINLLNECVDNIYTVYPENDYNIMDSYTLYNYDINKLENMYLKKISKISSSKYYNLKLKGIKIKYIKAYSNALKIKKCNNYLEKFEPV